MKDIDIYIKYGPTVMKDIIKKELSKNVDEFFKTIVDINPKSRNEWMEEFNTWMKVKK